MGEGERELAMIGLRSEQGDARQPLNLSYLIFKLIEVSKVRVELVVWSF